LELTGIEARSYRRNRHIGLNKQRLAGATVREASTDEVVDLKKENSSLKQAVAGSYLRNDWLKNV